MAAEIEEPTRPILRYHGGKWNLAQWVIGNFPEHRVYTESFGGAASVLIQKPRSYGEIYNDLDGEICNLFRVLRNPSQGRELRRILELTPFARDEFDNSYLPDGDPIEQARRTVVRSFMGFGSVAASGRLTGFRSNSNRSGTTPAHDWANYPTTLDALTARLQGVVIENRPASHVMFTHDTAETLHYVDPPYPHGTRTGTAQYDRIYRFEMKDDDHRFLAKTLRTLDGMVILSGYPCALYDEELYPDWHRVERRSVADGARPRTEVLWFNDAARSMRKQQTLRFA